MIYRHRSNPNSLYVVDNVIGCEIRERQCPLNKKVLHEGLAAVLEKILKIPMEGRFFMRQGKPMIPVRAKVFSSFQSARQGETEPEHPPRVRGGKYFGIPCSVNMPEGGKPHNSFYHILFPRPAHLVFPQFITGTLPVPIRLFFSGKTSPVRFLPEC
jgi:hypothetical protein